MYMASMNRANISLLHAVIIMYGSINNRDEMKHKLTYVSVNVCNYTITGILLAFLSPMCSAKRPFLVHASLA